MAINATPVRPGLIGGKQVAPRGVEPKRFVQDTEGTVHEMSLTNAYDCVNIRGWKMVPKSGSVSAAKAAEATEDADVSAEDTIKVSTPVTENEIRDLGELTALRDEAVKLGIAVDNRWGIRKLRERIAESKEAETNG